MFHTLLQKQYGLHLKDMQKSKVGAGSDTWFLDCNEGKFVLKFPSKSKINHPELEPELCAFLRKNGIPACDFLKIHLATSSARQTRVNPLQCKDFCLEIPPNGILHHKSF